MEEWRNINEFYAVSNIGRVKSLEKDVVRVRNGKKIIWHYNEKILKPNESNVYGHLQVIFYKNGVREIKSVHRLVAEAFIPNPSKCSDVHHIDHNPKNNKVENLKWMNGNEHHKIHGTELAKRVDQIDKITGEVLRQWNSAMDIERELGHTNGNISRCCNGKRPSAYGFIWKHPKS